MDATPSTVTGRAKAPGRYLDVRDQPAGDSVRVSGLPRPVPVRPAAIRAGHLRGPHLSLLDSGVEAALAGRTTPSPSDAALRLDPRRSSRLAALGALAMGVALAAKLPEVTGAAPYLGLVAAGLLVLAFGTVAWLWASESVASRMGVAGLAVALGTGQALNLAVGLPGAPSLHGGIGPLGLVALVAEAFVLAVVLAPGLRPKR